MSDGACVWSSWAVQARYRSGTECNRLPQLGDRPTKTAPARAGCRERTRVAAIGNTRSVRRRGFAAGRSAVGIAGGDGSRIAASRRNAGYVRTTDSSAADDDGADHMALKLKQT